MEQQQIIDFQKNKIEELETALADVERMWRKQKNFKQEWRKQAMYWRNEATKEARR